MGEFCPYCGRGGDEMVKKVDNTGVVVLILLPTVAFFLLGMALGVNWWGVGFLVAVGLVVGGVWAGATERAANLREKRRAK